MAITRYTYRNPWAELDQFTNRLSRALGGGEFPTPSSGGDWMPAVNVEETRDELVLTAELPGMAREDVNIEVENNILTISGERSEERTEGEEKRYHLWERHYGSFQRSFTLPRTVQPEQITADFEHGLLRIRMPKAAEAKTRRIEISSRSETETH
jgi:HSP20 family protein